MMSLTMIHVWRTLPTRMTGWSLMWMMMIAVVRVHGSSITVRILVDGLLRFVLGW